MAGISHQFMVLLILQTCTWIVKELVVCTTRVHTLNSSLIYLGAEQAA